LTEEGTVSTQQVTTNSLDKRLLLKALVALKQGDFTFRLPDEWTGLDGKIADTLNELVATNNKLVKEVERVSRVVGREGKITQRVTTHTVEGSWRDLVESVNALVEDLSRATTEMARVIGAVANGDLSTTM